MTRLRIPSHSTSLFTWDSESSTFVIEASSLPRPMCNQVWDDAADLGFNLISEKTGDAIEVFLMKELKDAEGDVLYWQFEPGLKSRQRGKFIVRVFND